jgi:ferrous iron transport protein B
MSALKTDPTAVSNSAPIILVGNPNVGKSVLFGALTGTRVTVSNYPGTTVEISSGKMDLEGQKATLIDTPGVNSLTPTSDDERVTRNTLLDQPPRLVLQVADAKNLRRALLISLQLSEMGLPFILDLNMSDEAKSRGVSIDNRRLGELLGITVTETVATRQHGIDSLRQSLQQTPAPSLPFSHYDPAIEGAVSEISPLLPAGPIRPEALALMFLAGDDSLLARYNGSLAEEKSARLGAIRSRLQAAYKQPLSYAINQQRMAQVDMLMKQIFHHQHLHHRDHRGRHALLPAKGEPLSQWLGELMVHPIWGVPFLLLSLWLTYKIVGEFGAGTLVGLLEEDLFGRWINPFIIQLVTAYLPWQLLQDLLVGEYGVFTMALTYGLAIVLPIVSTFFIVFSILEDSGYLPRLAVMVNRPFKAMGLNGRAVLPMILGLGCDTMATMTTRILQTRKERLQVTLLLALGVPCSAQLGVILGMLGLLHPAATLIWGAVMVAVMLAVGYLASKVIPGEKSEFILELPPIRLPQLSNIFFKTLARLEWYLKEVLPLFILGSLILFILDRSGLLLLIEAWASPLVVSFLGLPAKATDSFLIGFLRRDYGAAGLFAMAHDGLMTSQQTMVSLMVITLFVPCIANLLIIVKEYGTRTALAMSTFIFPFAFLVGGILNWGLTLLHVSL